jgi:hypothetical protein
MKDAARHNMEEEDKTEEDMMQIRQKSTYS